MVIDGAIPSQSTDTSESIQIEFRRQSVEKNQTENLIPKLRHGNNAIEINKMLFTKVIIR